MKFYVRYSTADYEGDDEQVFDTIDAVIEFLNAHAQNPKFRFDVIKGQRLKFKAVERVKAYDVDRE